MEAAGRSYLVVGVEGEEFGLDVGRVRTVVEYREPTPVPGRPGPLVGALNHHGELLPVASLAALLGRKPRIDPLRSVIVVVNWDDALLGLLVERSHGLLTPLERTRLTHVLGRWDGPYLEHTLETEGRRIHVLDLGALLADVARRL
ncbi:MAG: chemotaxis protein CheW [Thermodesulfobacteriota bacterium]